MLKYFGNKSPIFQINLLLFSEFIVIACLDMADPYWPLIVRSIETTSHINNATLWTVLIYTVPFLMSVLFAPFWASLGKRFGYKKMLIRSTLVLAITQLFLFYTNNLMQMLLMRILQGAFAGFTATAQSWLVYKTNDEKHGYFVGKVQAIMAMGTIVGPVIGGFISDFYPYHVIFLSSGILCFLITLLIAGILSETDKHNNNKIEFNILKKLRFNQDIKHNFSWLFLIFSSQSLRWMNVSFFALYITSNLHGNNITIGMLYAVIAIMIYISAPKWGNLVDRSTTQFHKIRLSLLFALSVGAITQFIYAQSHNIFFVMIASAFLGISLGALNSIPFCMLIQRYSTEKKGVLIGYASSSSKLGNFAGVAIGGYIYALTNIHTAFCAIGFGYIVILTFALIVLLSYNKVNIIPYRKSHANPID